MRAPPPHPTPHLPPPPTHSPGHPTHQGHQGGGGAAHQGRRARAEEAWGGGGARCPPSSRGRPCWRPGSARRRGLWQRWLWRGGRGPWGGGSRGGHAYRWRAGARRQVCGCSVGWVDGVHRVAATTPAPSICTRAPPLPLSSASPRLCCRSRRARNRVNYAFADYDESLRSGGLGNRAGQWARPLQQCAGWASRGALLACQACQMASLQQRSNACRCGAPAALPAALRHRGEDDSDDEGGRRRRRVSLTLTLPGYAVPACLPALSCTPSTASSSARERPSCPMMQRGASPPEDPEEAARGGLRRGRSAVSTKG